MKHCLRFLHLFTVLIILLQLFTPVQLHALDTPELIISEVKVRNDTLGFDEYIELTNPTEHDVQLVDYFINYVNSPAPSSTQPFTKAAISSDLLPGGESIVLAKNELDINLIGSLKSPFASLSDSGGTVKITNKDDEIIDQIAWSSTLSLAIPPILYLANTTATKSQSFIRQKDVDGKEVLENAIWLLATPNPVSSALIPAPLPEPDPEPIPVPETPLEPEVTPLPDEQNQPPIEQSPTENTPTLLPAIITELLPNPAAPASDSRDEFIELYNPNDQPLDLKGYKLQSGNSFSYSHVLDTVLDPRSYKTFYVSETGNILSNTSGQARLLDPQGVVVAQTNSYDSAEEGEAWALINGAWQWTTTITPNAENVLNIPVLKLVTAVKAPAAKKTTAKTTAKVKKTTAKVASAKTSKSSNSAPTRQVYEDPAAAEVAPIHPGVLAGVGVITLVYAVYEYRYDAVNALNKFRRYREIRRSTRP